MSLISSIRDAGQDLGKSVFELRLRFGEYAKIKDKRRQAINALVQLTEEQKKAIDAFYLSNYGKKVPYDWHQHYYAMSGKFDEKYLPELLYICEFERYMNQSMAHVEVLADKNLLPIIAKAVGVKTPRTIISSTKGMLRDSEYRRISQSAAMDILSEIGEVFAKPSVDTSSGQGCFVADIHNGVDTVSGRSVQELLKCLGGDFVIQERLRCSDAVARIYPQSVNTFRVITYRWKDEIRFFPLIMRIGQGGNYLDNAHAGGMYIAVSDEGYLGKAATTEFNIKFEEHPDTHLKFEGYYIPGVAAVMAAARRIHEALPQLGVVNWDFIIDQNNEPVLIEGNTIYGSVWLVEGTHGCGPFGENAAEVLQWMRKMRSLRPSQRYQYMFGRMDETD